jgi:hypothetical protein
MFQHSETGNVAFVDSPEQAEKFGKENPRWIVIPLCAAPLAQPEPEPVAWWDGKESVVFAHDTIYTPNWTDYWTTPLYKDPTPCKTCEALARTVMMDQTSHDTAPPKREWVGLTDEEIMEAWKQIFEPGHTIYAIAKQMAMTIEAKLKEKNGVRDA